MNTEMLIRDLDELKLQNESLNLRVAYLEAQVNVLVNVALDQAQNEWGKIKNRNTYTLEEIQQLGQLELTIPKLKNAGLTS